MGLSIGRVIFGALNKIEWVLALAIVFNYLLFHKNFIEWNLAWIGCAILILLVQSVWALPALTRRAKKIISGIKLPSSSLHKYYILLEVVKVAALIIYGLHLFQ